MSGNLSEEVRSALAADFSEFTFGAADGHYLLIDIGANLTNRKFTRDLDIVLQRARDVGKFNSCSPSPAQIGFSVLLN